MEITAIRKALEAMLGQKEAALALAGAGGRPTRVTAKSLRSAEALWV